MREHRLRSSLLPFSFVVAFAGVAGVGASVGPFAMREAHASVAIAASIEDLARASSVIARVTALDRESAWEGGRIVTYSRVRIDSVIAGALPAPTTREIRVRTLGGRVGDVGQIVEGEAALAPSESSLVFLAKAESTFVVMGRAQGQLLVRRDTHGREIVRVGVLGELVERRIHPPLRATGRRITELDGAMLDVAARDARTAWEASHAR
jgi:hypothetical protein